ncbi:MAG: FHA domain-containing protein [Burkholderiales bacterium]
MGEVAGTSPRRTTVLYARVDAAERPRGEALRRRVRCVAALSQAAELSGGRVLRKQPDAVMAVFSSADAATAAAARMQAYAEAGGLKSAEMKVRIGYESGRVTQRGRDVAGQTVELAREIAGQARDGQILTTAETALSLAPGICAAVRALPSVSILEGQELREVLWPDALARRVTPKKNAIALPVLRLAYADKQLVRRRETEFVTLGRDPSLDLFIDDTSASRHHCHIVRRDGKFVLRDHSANGTYVTVEGEGETHLHVGSLVLRKSGWISLGIPADLTEARVRYACE